MGLDVDWAFLLDGLVPCTIHAARCTHKGVYIQPYIRRYKMITPVSKNCRTNHLVIRETYKRHEVE